MLAHLHHKIYLISGFLVIMTKVSAEVVPPTPPNSPGGTQVLPIPPANKQTPEALEGGLSESQTLPKPGVYRAEPWSLIIKVPEPVDSSMPTVFPPQQRYTGRSIEPRLRLVPRK